jgi:hypothetical protein
LRDSLRFERVLFGSRQVSKGGDRRKGKKRREDEPIEHPEQLHDPLLPPTRPRRRNLNRKLMHAPVLSQNRQAAEVHSMPSIDLVLVRKVRDPNKVVVVVLVLEILTGDFNLVELLVLEFDEPVRGGFEVGPFGFLVERCFVAVAPGLEAGDVLAESRLGGEEVLLELGLFRGGSQRKNGEERREKDEP